MSEIRDPRLDSLFSQARENLPGDAFTDRVMTRSRFLKYRMHTIAAGTLLLLLVAAQVFLPPMRDFGLMIAWGLTTNIIDLGEGWLAFAVSPVNTVGSLLVICFKGVLMLRKWMRRGIDLR